MAGIRPTIPLSIKLLYSICLWIILSVYLDVYGAKNFLWFCDIALFLGLLAVWLENRLFASMATVGTLLFTLGWNADFFTGGRMLGLVGYMFDPSIPLHLRGLSLFHVGLPLFMLWLTYRLGYDPRAFVATTALMWGVALVTYLATDRAENINWVFGPVEPQSAIDPVLYLLLLMITIALVVCLPTHLFLSAWLGRGAPTSGRSTTYRRLRQP